MPVKECILEGKPGYKWGEEGHCYIYKPGDEASQNKARKDANAQGIAVIRSGYKPKENQASSKK